MPLSDGSRPRDDKAVAESALGRTCLGQTLAVAGTRSPKRTWIVLAVVAAVSGVLSVISAAVLLWRARWFEAAFGLGLDRASYWFTVGAWLRTPWAELEAVDPIPGPPPLEDARPRRYLVAACLAGVALALALATQAIYGQWVD